MRSYLTLALRYLKKQRVTSILILIAVILSTMMTAVIGQSVGILSAMRQQQAVMIGDRYTDIDGAHACNLDAIGCRWGYAPAGEMEEHGAYEIIEKPEQIEEAVNRYFQTH